MSNAPNDFQAWAKQCAEDMRANLEHWDKNPGGADEKIKFRESSFSPPEDERADYSDDQPRDEHGRFAAGGVGLEGRGEGSSSGVGRAGGEPHGGSTLLHIGDQSRVVGHQHPSKVDVAKVRLADKLKAGKHPQVGPDGRLTGKMVPVTLQGPIEKHVADMQAQIAAHQAELHGFRELVSSTAHSVAGLKPEVNERGKPTGNMIPAAIVESRVKDLGSAIGKLDRKADKYTNASSMHDTTGARVIVPTLAHVQQVVNKLENESGMKSLPQDREDYIKNPKPDTGYRSMHIVLQGQNGLTKEVQIRTENQHVHAEFSHDIYKPKSDQQAYVAKNAAALAAYQRSLGEHFAAIDSGKTYPGTNVPSGPPVVKPPAGFREVIPKAKAITALHDEPSAYFHVTKDTPMIPLERLSVTRARPEGIAHAAKLMAKAAYDGGEKRVPIDVERDPNKPGHFKVVDGNSTTNIAMRNGWKALPVVIHEPGTYVDPKAKH